MKLQFLIYYNLYNNSSLASILAIKSIEILYDLL